VAQKTFIFLFYSFFLLILGRNLLFIPVVSIGGTTKAKDTEAIRQDVVDLLKDKKGEFNVCYTDLITEDSFGIHPDTVLTGASMNKLPVVGYLYFLAGKKEIDLQETVVIQKSDIQDYGTGVIRYEEPGKTYTLQYLAQLALQKSDNTAAHVLNIRLGEDNIQAFAFNLGMSATNMVENDTSCRDIQTFFKKLFANKIAPEALTKEMMGYMENTDFEDRLPRFLPRNLHVYHKTGDGVNFIHDGGIISNGNTPFILVVTSSNLTDEEEAKVTIGKIAEKIFLDRGKK
jgi:beta-lactamase class A